MSLYVLDTDHVSLAQREHPAVTRRLAVRDARELAVTIISAEEQMRGWLNAIRRASRSRERLRWAYAGLRSTLDFFRTARVLDFDQAVRRSRCLTGEADREGWNPGPPVP